MIPAIAVVHNYFEKNLCLFISQHGHTMTLRSRKIWFTGVCEQEERKGQLDRSCSRGQKDDMMEREKKRGGVDLGAYAAAASGTGHSPLFSLLWVGTGIQGQSNIWVPSVYIPPASSSNYYQSTPKGRVNSWVGSEATAQDSNSCLQIHNQGKG